MRFFSIFFSIISIIIFAIQPLFFNNKNFNDIILLILNKSLYINLSIGSLFLSYLFYFFSIKKKKDLLFIFFFFLCLIISFIALIFCINLPFFNIKTNQNIIKLILYLFLFFHIFLFTQMAIFKKIDNYLLLFVFRLLFFIIVLFTSLTFFGNKNFNITYQYILLFSILFWRILVHFIE